jgi:hypothetical protein
MKRRKVLGTPKNINVEVIDLKVLYKYDYSIITFKIEGYELLFTYCITKRENLNYELMADLLYGNIYSNSSIKKVEQYLKVEKNKELKEKLLKSIETNIDFVEHRLYVLDLLTD